MASDSPTPWQVDKLTRLARDVALPAMFVDLDILDANTAYIAQIAKRHDKRMRIASKSIRVPALLRRILDRGGAHFQGLMCFSPQEAHYLAQEGFDDLLIAYPSVQDADLDVLWQLTQDGTDVTLMLDNAEHIRLLDAYWQGRSQENTDARPLQVCIDADMSYKLLGQHLGVQRSSIRDLDAFAAIVTQLTQTPSLKLHGVMGYEAQIAGLSDTNPFTPLFNPIKRLLKRLSTGDVSKKREALHKHLQQQGVEIAIFNGGGTGSLHSTTQEPWLTEVTAGSGFLQSHLFDYYQSNQNAPAFCFALQLTRKPQDGIVVCQSGGFIASGETSPDKAPIPFLPSGLEIIPAEGFGEVQTPLNNTHKHPLAIGDPLFFRPAKAGEIAEHFQEYILLQNHQIVERVPTYRGLGQRFF